MQVLLDALGAGCHPEHHPRDEAHRYDRHRSGECRGGFVAQGIVDEGQHQSDSDGDADRNTHPEPGHPDGPAIAGLDEVGHQDHHDEGGFEPLTQADQKVGKHSGLLGATRSGT